MKQFVYEVLLRFGNKGTKLIGMYWGEVFPFWYVCEYPRSGGTWLGRMVADYLDIPFPQHPVMPLGMSCVIHTHWRYSPRLNRVLYLYRDGRDIMVSYYFYRMRMIRLYPDSPHAQGMKKKYERLYGPGFDTEDIRQNLPLFIEEEMKHPRGSRTNWPDHITNWCEQGRTGIAYLGYEDLLADPVKTLNGALAQFLESIDDDALARAVERYRFENMTGRRPGEEARGEFARKGISGDWENHFTRAAAEVFEHYAGNALVTLGYEQNSSWVAKRPEQ